MINSYESTEKSRSMFTEVYTQKRGTCITVIILGIIIGIFAFAYITFGNETIADSLRTNNTLKFVSIIVEHGQTAPKFTYPNDLYRNDSRWQSSLGELSKRGKQSMYNLGKFFRERYSVLLPDLYFSSDIRVLSSNADSCLMSAAVLLAGLYPPHKFQVWNTHVLWQPIPVKGISEEVDKMIDVTQSCPSLYRKRKQIETAVITEDVNLPKLFDFLSENTGMEIRNLSSILALYNLFFVQDKTGLPLPDWTQIVYPEKMLNYSIKALEMETTDAEITKLTTGVLLDKIILDMMEKSSDELSTKMFLYSTHEQSIFNILRVLNKKKVGELPLKPDFSSSVMIELHTIEEKNIVQAFYLNKTGKSLIHINITDCGDPCFLDNFIKFAKPFIPHDWVKACSRGLHSLARIGDDLYVEPTEEGLSFRTVNTAQSAYSSLVFDLPFFTQYMCEFDTEDGGKCKLSMKACLAVFKTPNCMDRNVDSCKIEIDKNFIKLSFQVRFLQGFTKNFFLSVTDNETVQLKYNKDEMCNKMSIMSRTLYGAIKHFRVNDDEITFSVTAEKARLKNYFQNVEVSNQKVVRTNLCLQPSEFEMYDIQQPGSITFALRELRAVCTFSELSNSSPVGIYFEAAGKPVIFSVRNSSMYEADYVVSTLPSEMINGERPHRRSQLSDVVSTIPSTACGNLNRKRKLVPVVEEPEPTTSTPSVPETRMSVNKSGLGRNISTPVPRVSLVDIIKYSDDRRSTPQPRVETEDRVPSANPNTELIPNDVLDFPPDDINNECIEMIYDQVDELTRSQAERIDKVFKYCYSYCSDSPVSLDTDEILCNASDIVTE